MVKLWDERVEWWQKKFKFDKRFKIQAHGQPACLGDDVRGEVGDMGGMGIMGGGSGSGMGSAGAAPERLMEAPAPAMMLREERPEPRMEREEARREEAERDEEKKSDKAKGKEGDDGEEQIPEPTIRVAEWNPETPYLKELKAASKKAQWKTYMELRGKNADAPSFFLDCADFFYSQKEPRFALQVLSNVAELKLDDPSLLRVLGHRLEQRDELKLARMMFEQVLKLRPEEPQSYRDLALVLDRLGNLPRAAQLLYTVVTEKWDRFDEIEVVALMELNRIMARTKWVDMGGKQDKMPEIDARLKKLLDTDVRIVLTWDTDMSDMDLWVTEPCGEKAYYEHNRTTIGGLVSRDFTDGYGPEEYFVRKAMRGTYKIEANFYGINAPTVTGAVTVQAEVFTNFGREDEKRQSLTLRLEKRADTYLVGEITF